MITRLQVSSTTAINGVLYTNTDSQSLKTSIKLIQIVNTSSQTETIEMWIRDNATNENIVCLLPTDTSLSSSEMLSDEAPHNVMAGQHVYYEASSSDVMIEMSLSEGYW